MAKEHAISPELMKHFSQLIMDKLGLHYPPDTWPELEKKLFTLSKSAGFKTLSACIEWFVQSPLNKKSIDLLAAHLTIGETYFFRDANTFRALRDKILPDLIQKRSHIRHLNIWSAGCCTGEEPYSVAILLDQMLPHKDWSITILGTDLNNQFLQQAESGLFKSWSFRATPQAIKDIYFKPQGTKYLLNSKIRNMVTFRYLNLAENDYPSSFNQTDHVDLILCNNVLIYFSFHVIQKVVHNFSKALNEGGWLVVTPIESPYIEDPKLVPIKFHEFLLFKKANTIQPLAEPSISSFISPSHETKVSEPFKPVPSLLPPALSPTPTRVLAKNLDNQLSLQATKAYQQGLYQEAVAFLEEKIDKGIPLESHDNQLLIKSYINLSELDRARQFCEKQLKTNKLDPILYYLRGQIFLEHNQLPEAIESLKKALFLDSNFIVAHFALGNLLRASGDQTGAQRHFRNAFSLLQHHPKDKPLRGEEEDLTPVRLLDLVKNLLI